MIQFCTSPLDKPPALAVADNVGLLNAPRTMLSNDVAAVVALAAGADAAAAAAAVGAPGFSTSIGVAVGAVVFAVAGSGFTVDGVSDFGAAAAAAVADDFAVTPATAVADGDFGLFTTAACVCV